MFKDGSARATIHLISLSVLLMSSIVCTNLVQAKEEDMRQTTEKFTGVTCCAPNGSYGISNREGYLRQSSSGGRKKKGLAIKNPRTGFDVSFSKVKQRPIRTGVGEDAERKGVMLVNQEDFRHLQGLQEKNKEYDDSVIDSDILPDDMSLFDIHRNVTSFKRTEARKGERPFSSGKKMPLVDFRLKGSKVDGNEPQRHVHGLQSPSNSQPVYQSGRAVLNDPVPDIIGPVPYGWRGSLPRHSASVIARKDSANVMSPVSKVNRLFSGSLTNGQGMSGTELLRGEHLSRSSESGIQYQPRNLHLSNSKVELNSEYLEDKNTHRQTMGHDLESFKGSGPYTNSLRYVDVDEESLRKLLEENSNLRQLINKKVLESSSKHFSEQESKQFDGRSGLSETRSGTSLGDQSGISLTAGRDALHHLFVSQEQQYLKPHEYYQGRQNTRSKSESSHAIGLSSSVSEMRNKPETLRLQPSGDLKPNPQPRLSYDSSITGVQPPRQRNVNPMLIHGIPESGFPSNSFSQEKMRRQEFPFEKFEDQDAVHRGEDPHGGTLLTIKDPADSEEQFWDQNLQKYTEEVDKDGSKYKMSKNVRRGDMDQVTLGNGKSQSRSQYVSEFYDEVPESKYTKEDVDGDNLRYHHGSSNVLHKSLNFHQDSLTGPRTVLHKDSMYQPYPAFGDEEILKDFKIDQQTQYRTPFQDKSLGIKNPPDDSHQIEVEDRGHLKTLTKERNDYKSQRYGSPVFVYQTSDHVYSDDNKLASQQDDIYTAQEDGKRKSGDQYNSQNQFPTSHVVLSVGTTSSPRVSTLANPTQEDCSGAEENCMCSLSSALNDFGNLASLDPEDFRLGLENYNCSDYSRPSPRLDLREDWEEPEHESNTRWRSGNKHGVPRKIPASFLESVLRNNSYVQDTGNKHSLLVDYGSAIACYDEKEFQGEVAIGPVNVDWGLVGRKLTADPVQSKNGYLEIKSASVRDIGSYVCSVSYRRFLDGKPVRKQYYHNVTVVAVPTFIIEAAVSYASSSCETPDAETFNAMMPRVLLKHLCQSSYCEVTKLQSSCAHGKAKTDRLNLAFTLNVIPLQEKMYSDRCNFPCFKLLQVKFTSLLLNNVAKILNTSVVSRSPLRSLVFRPITSSIVINLLMGCREGFELIGDTCYPCKEEHFSLEDSDRCEPCPSGSYQPLRGARDCMPCPSFAPGCYYNQYLDDKRMVYLGVGAGVVVCVVLTSFVLCFCPFAACRNSPKVCRCTKGFREKRAFRSQQEDDDISQRVFRHKKKRGGAREEDLEASEALLTEQDDGGKGSTRQYKRHKRRDGPPEPPIDF